MKTITLNQLRRARGVVRIAVFLAVVQVAAVGRGQPGPGATPAPAPGPALTEEVEPAKGQYLPPSDKNAYFQLEDNVIFWRTIAIISMFVASMLIGAVIALAYKLRLARRAASSQPRLGVAPSTPASSSTAAPEVTPPASSSTSGTLSLLGGRLVIPARGTTPKFFISYRRDDSADVTGRIYDRLKEAFGAEFVFKDVDSIPLGFDFREHLDREVSQCDIVLVVIGSHWSQGSPGSTRSRLDEPTDLVRIEIESALRRRIPVIPVLVRGAQMPDQTALPDSLRELVYRHAISVRADPDFHNDMTRLIASCKKLGDATLPR